MAIGTREIKRRIKSISSTKKITKAMEMVAAAKMRKAVAAVIATRDYANLAWTTILNLAEKTDSEQHVLLRQPRKVDSVGLIIIGSNRGLCGGFNFQIAQKAVASIKKFEHSVKKTEIISFGSRPRDIMRMMKFDIAADFVKQDLTLSVTDITAIARIAIDKFKNQQYDKVFIAFTDFVSPLKQVPRVKQILPIQPEPDEYLGVVGESEGIAARKKFIQEKKEKYLRKGKFHYEYIFEPSATVVLREMLPRLIEMQIYQAVLESEAAEHCARMAAMRNASEAAGDMIDDLTLSYNRARQAKITREIAEISSGAAALVRV